MTFTCTRSTEESTKRAVPLAPRLFAEHVPRLGRLAEFEFHPGVIDAAENGITKLEVRREPIGLETKSRRRCQFLEHVAQNRAR